MMFGAISGSAVASAAAVGGTMSPLQKKEGYDPAYSAAVNITSCPTGLLIPPSNTFIVYSLISGGTSIGALFLAGYIPGMIMGLSLMMVAGFIAKKRGYPVSAKPSTSEVVKKNTRRTAKPWPNYCDYGRYYWRYLHRDRSISNSGGVYLDSCFLSSTAKFLSNSFLILFWNR